MFTIKKSYRNHCRGRRLRKNGRYNLSDGLIPCGHAPPFKENIMGEGHKVFNPDKTRDEDFRLLTYAAIAADFCILRRAGKPCGKRAFRRA